jgi:hypothetical protein
VTAENILHKEQKSETSMLNKEEQTNRNHLIKHVHKITAIRINFTREETNKFVNFAAKKVMK